MIFYVIQVQLGSMHEAEIAETAEAPNRRSSPGRRKIESTQDLKRNPRLWKLDTLPLCILYSLIIIIILEILQDFVLRLQLQLRQSCVDKAGAALQFLRLTFRLAKSPREQARGDTSLGQSYRGERLSDRQQEQGLATQRELTKKLV